MSETTMPAAEATDVAFDERNSYEFAFHVLPTVAEGEVAGAFDEIKAHIAKNAEITSEEAPERVDLAYPIVKSMEGKNRKFTSSYFGWVRFKMDGEKVNELTEEFSGIQTNLRHLLIKLTAQEEIHPFRFHENRKSVKMVEVVKDDSDTLGEIQTETEESAEVSEEALDESLEKITHEEEKVA
ncbi:MAG: 30S ribosomal protein S6 [Candidatus Pacebacteria bacterium]|nr:30S ribosomal protein S6 [Candidatus Paceibacterota bacterium]MCF7856880.1 30S ribosomal protein S6 [Candidatus Paceibacterota bacterium]